MNEKEKINIQLQLETVLSAIADGNGQILSEIINKLLIADYEIFNNLNGMGQEIGMLKKDIASLKEQIEDDIGDLIEEDAD